MASFTLTKDPMILFLRCSVLFPSEIKKVGLCDMYYIYLSAMYIHVERSMETKGNFVNCVFFLDMVCLVCCVHAYVLFCVRVPLIVLVDFQIYKPFF